MSEVEMILDTDLDSAIGYVGEIQFDGSAELILTDEGRKLFGNFTMVAIVNAGAPVEADPPAIVEAK